MSLNITLQNFSGQQNKVDKSGWLSTGVTLVGDQLDIGQTVLDLSVVISSQTTPNYNYCYIAEFKRYYYIKNIAWLGGTAFQLDLHVDVLYTYKTQITAQQCMVAYSTSGDNLELDPRMNYVDQAVRSDTYGAQYPQFLLDYGLHPGSDYEAQPLVAVRFRNMIKYDPNQPNDDYTSINIALMTQESYLRVMERYLDNNVFPEASRVEWGSQIIDVTTIYYLSEYRLSQVVNYTAGWTIVTPSNPSGITLPLAGAAAYVYIFDRIPDVRNLGYTIMNGANITAANNWTLGGKYVTKIPYIGTFTVIPAEFGIKTVKQLYWQVAVDLYTMEYVVVLTDKTDGTGTYWFDSLSRIKCGGIMAFPVDKSIENLQSEKIALNLSGLQSVGDATINEELTPVEWGAQALRMHTTYLKMTAADALSYKWQANMDGYSEWTMCDTTKLINISYTRPPDTDYISFNNMFGKPDHTMRTLSALTGYVKVEDIILNGISTATSRELDEIESLLKQGVVM